MFQKISVENFKSIKNLPDFEMKPVNLLIGANNSGKSNFLDVFAFLRDTAALYGSAEDEGWRAALARRGGADSIAHQGAERFKIEVASGVFQYNIEIESSGWNAGLRDETLQNLRSHETILQLDQQRNGVSFYKNGQWHSTSPFTLGYTGLAEFVHSKGRNCDEQTYGFAKQVSEIKIYDRLHTEIWSPVRTPQVSKGETILDEDGGNLVGVLHQLSEVQPQFLTELNRRLKILFPDFMKVAFPHNSKGEILIRWEDAGGRVMNTSQLSDGTLKFLCLIAILKNPNPPALIGIDEADANLHPLMQVILADMIHEASRRTQIIATTHSPHFVSMFTPEEIVILQQYKAETEMRRFSDKGALELWLKRFSTQELWLMGELESRW